MQVSFLYATFFETIFIILCVCVCVCACACACVHVHVWFLHQMHTETCFCSVLYHSQFETEIEMSCHIVVKLPYIKCDENLFGGSRFFTCRQMHRHTWWSYTDIFISSCSRHTKKNNYCGACIIFLNLSVI
jgi:hypothetical protein